MIPVATGGPLESCFTICSHQRFATEVVIILELDRSFSCRYSCPVVFRNSREELRRCDDSSPLRNEGGLCSLVQFRGT